MVKKTCTCCRQEKGITEYHFKNKEKGTFRSICKSCHSEKRKKYYQENKEVCAKKTKEYRKNNIEICRERSRSYYKNNKEHHNKITKAWYEKNKEYALNQYAEYREKNRQRIRDYHKEHYAKNKPEINKRHMQYNKEKYRTDPLYKLKSDLSRRIRKALKNSKELKSKKTLEYLGCDLDFLKGYIESQFREGMSWEVFFKGEIHIDHILPCASFDLTDPQQRRECFHYSNLQPLWAKENHEKRDKLDYKVAV